MLVLDEEEWSDSRRYHFTSGGKRSWYGVEAGWAPDPVWTLGPVGSPNPIPPSFNFSLVTVSTGLRRPSFQYYYGLLAYKVHA